MALTGGAELVKVNTRDMIADKPTLDLTDSTEGLGGEFIRLPCPIGLEVCPYTEYELSFSKKGRAIEGQPPVVSLNEWDINYDHLQEHVCPITPAEDETWQVQTFVIRTGPKTRYLAPMLQASTGGTANLSLGGFALRQVSEPMHLRPVPKVVFERRNVKLGTASEAEVMGEGRLPEGDSAYEARANFRRKSSRAGLPSHWNGSTRGGMCSGAIFARLRQRPASSRNGIAFAPAGLVGMASQSTEPVLG